MLREGIMYIYMAGPREMLLQPHIITFAEACQDIHSIHAEHSTNDNRVS